LRHVQGSLLEWTGPDTTLQTPHEEYLASLVGEVARELGALGDRLEAELGSWRGEA